MRANKAGKKPEVEGPQRRLFCVLSEINRCGAYSLQLSVYVLALPRIASDRIVAGFLPSVLSLVSSLEPHAVEWRRLWRRPVAPPEYSQREGAVGDTQ